MRKINWTKNFAGSYKSQINGWTLIIENLDKEWRLTAIDSNHVSESDIAPTFKEAKAWFQKNANDGAFNS